MIRKYTFRTDKQNRQARIGARIHPCPVRSRQVRVGRIQPWPRHSLFVDPRCIRSSACVEHVVLNGCPYLQSCMGASLGPSRLLPLAPARAEQAIDGRFDEARRNPEDRLLPARVDASVPRCGPRMALRAVMQLSAQFRVLPTQLPSATGRNQFSHGRETTLWVATTLAGSWSRTNVGNGTEYGRQDAALLIVNPRYSPTSQALRHMFNKPVNLFGREPKLPRKRALVIASFCECGKTQAKAQIRLTSGLCL